MKTLSYIALALAGVCFILAFAAHFFSAGRIIFNWDKYISAVVIFLLTSIVFALYHLILLKSK